MVLPKNQKVVFEMHAFLTMCETLVNNFGSAGESMIYQMGRENGVYMAKQVVQTLTGPEIELEGVFGKVLNKLSQNGWADIQIKEFNLVDGSVEVLMMDNVFEKACLSFNLPQCFFLRGYIAGIIHEVTNADYSFFSSHCYAFGDPDCRIKLVKIV